MEKKLGFRNSLSLEDQLCIISVPTIKLLLTHKDPQASVSLYMFYYYTAKWQKTNQPRATPRYCMDGLNMGRDKFYAANKFLQSSGLIDHVITRNNKGKVTGWYVRINYIWSDSKASKLSTSTLLKNHSVDKPQCGFEGTNALSVSSLNASSVSNKMLKVNDFKGFKENMSLEKRRNNISRIKDLVGSI